MRRLLLVTDHGLGAANILGRVLAARCDHCIVFDGTPTNPTAAAVVAALTVCRTEGCDGVIDLRGHGPGSTIALERKTNPFVGEAAR